MPLLTDTTGQQRPGLREVNFQKHYIYQLTLVHCMHGRYVLVVKWTDSKSVGPCLRRFESCRFSFNFFFVPLPFVLR